MKKFTALVRRNSLAIGAVIILFAFMAILVLQAVATSQLQSQVESQQTIVRQIQELAKSLNNKAAERTDQINRLSSHVDCIAKLFAQSNRTYSRIVDIESCTIKNTATGQVQSTGTQTTSGGVSASTQSTPVEPSAPATKSSVTTTPQLHTGLRELAADINSLLNGM